MADASHAPAQDEIIKLARIPLLIVDEVGYIPSARISQPVLPTRLRPLRTRQPIVTSNNLRRGEVFGDDIVAQK